MASTIFFTSVSFSTARLLSHGFRGSHSAAGVAVLRIRGVRAGTAGVPGTHAPILGARRPSRSATGNRVHCLPSLGALAALSRAPVILSGLRIIKERATANPADIRFFMASDEAMWHDTVGLSRSVSARRERRPISGIAAVIEGVSRRSGPLEAVAAAHQGLPLGVGRRARVRDEFLVADPPAAGDESLRVVADEPPKPRRRGRHGLLDRLRDPLRRRRIRELPLVHEQQSPEVMRVDRKSTRLNSSHLVISYAVFCLKKKKKKKCKK